MKIRKLTIAAILTGAVLLVAAIIFTLISRDGEEGGLAPEPVEAVEEFVNAGIYWDFDDPEAGTGGWEVVPEGEFWRYTGKAELSWDNTTFGNGMLRFDVDFTDSINIDWSEPKLRVYFDEPIEMRGITGFSFDIYFNPMLATDGHFKSKVIARDENRSIIDAGSNAISAEEEIGDYLKTTVRLTPVVKLNEGTMDNTIFSIAGYLTDYKGPVFFDNIRWETATHFAAEQVKPRPEITLGVPRPAPPEASPNKRRLMNYLEDQFGKSIISGQMDTSWTTNEYMDMITRVYTDTGKYPAIKGFDFLEIYNTNPPSFGGREQVNEAIEWWEGKNNGQVLLPGRRGVHGIVTFCWHWRTGPAMEFYTNRTIFRIPWRNGSLDTEHDNFWKIVEDLDRVAARLETLRERDIPVLWRPLHEASGGWFWWGASGRQAYIALWEFMYDYFTYEKGLNNLIWVWNADHADWFPNPATVDIVGRDIYSQSHLSRKDEFDKARAMDPSGKLIIALTENGRIPDPDECIKDDAMWSWFMTWNDRGGSEQGESHNDNFWTGENVNPQAHKMKVYHHPAVVTLDKLPDLTAYRLE